MRLKKTLLLIVLIAIVSVSFIYSVKKFNQDVTGESMLSAFKATQANIGDFAEYTYTADLLRELFDKDEEYVHRFLQNAKAISITLDPLFRGLKDSKQYTANENGYTEAQKSYGKELLKKLVRQQFTAMTGKNEQPTYTTIPGAPGTGKTYLLKKKYGIDIANGKFVPGSIIIGPDLVAMSQMEPFLAACELPIIDNRIQEMRTAYSVWRDWSNACANFMLIMALTENRNILHDSTMTSPITAQLLDVIGKLGYRRRGEVLMVDNASRAGALNWRAEQNGGFALVTTADAISKGVALYERITDGSYIGRFDELGVYVQEPNFYEKDSTPIQVAIYDNENEKMYVVSENKAHLDRILQDARETKNLEPELLTKFESLVASWEKVPESSSRNSNRI